MVKSPPRMSDRFRICYIDFPLLLASGSPTSYPLLTFSSDSPSPHSTHLLFSASMSEHVPLVIGTHTWAPDNDKEVGNILDVMRKHQLTMLDTARLYVCTNKAPAFYGAKPLKRSVPGPLRINFGSARVGIGVYHRHKSSYRPLCRFREEHSSVRQGEHGSSANQ